MSVEDKSVVDGISLWDGGKAIAMLIYDDSEWNDEFGHLMMIQNKVNAYLDYLETKQYLSIYADGEFEYGIFDMRFKNPFTENCGRLLHTLQEQLDSEGIKVEISFDGDMGNYEIHNVEIDDMFYYNDEFESFVAVIKNVVFMTKKVTPEIKTYAQQLAEIYPEKRKELTDYVFGTKEFSEGFPNISVTESEYVLGEPVLIIGEGAQGNCTYCNVNLAGEPMFEIAFSGFFENLGHFNVTY